MTIFDHSPAVLLFGRKLDRYKYFYQSGLSMILRVSRALKRFVHTSLGLLLAYSLKVWDLAGRYIKIRRTICINFLVISISYFVK